jgi:hypothetical protein
MGDFYLSAKPSGRDSSKLYEFYAEVLLGGYTDTGGTYWAEYPAFLWSCLEAGAKLSGYYYGDDRVDILVSGNLLSGYK